MARRLRPRWPGAQIAPALHLSASTVARILRRQGPARLRALEPPEPVRRYQWARPGGLVHLDVKKLGRIGRVGHRITGDRRGRVRGLGWEFIHVAIDDASRLAYVKILGDEGGATTTQFLWRALAWFRRHSIGVRRVMSDNCCGYVADRFARLREWAYRRAYPSSRNRTEALPAWLYYYNCARGHGALHGRPPIRSLAAPNNLMAVHHLGLTRARGRRRPGRRILLGYSGRVL